MQFIFLGPFFQSPMNTTGSLPTLTNHSCTQQLSARVIQPGQYGSVRLHPSIEITQVIIRLDPAIMVTVNDLFRQLTGVIKTGGMV